MSTGPLPTPGPDASPGQSFFSQMPVYMKPLSDPANPGSCKLRLGLSIHPSILPSVCLSVCLSVYVYIEHNLSDEGTVNTSFGNFK